MSKRNGIVILKFFWKEMNNGEYDSKYHKIVSWCSSTCGFWWEWKYEYLPRYQWLSRLNDKLHVVKDAVLDFMRKVIKFSHFFSLLTWMQSLLLLTIDKFKSLLSKIEHFNLWKSFPQSKEEEESWTNKRREGKKPIITKIIYMVRWLQKKKIATPTFSFDGTNCCAFYLWKSRYFLFCSKISK